MDFHRESIRAAAQYLESAQQLLRLPDPRTGDFLTTEDSVTLRSDQLNIAQKAESSFAQLASISSHPMPQPVQFEISALVLTAGFHANGGIALPSIVADAEKLLEDINVFPMGGEDKEELVPWSRIAMLRLLSAQGDPQYTQLLLEAATDLDDRDVAWQLLLAQLPLSVDNSAFELPIRTFDLMVDEVLSRPLKDREGLSVMATDPVQYSAGVLVRAGKLRHAKRLLGAFARLSGQQPTTNTGLVTFISERKVYAILSIDGKDSLFVAPIDARAFTAFIEASVEERPKQLAVQRRSLSSQLSPITQDQRILAAAPLEIDPFGFTSWIPWHGLSSTGGSTFASTASLRWRHPLTRTEPLEHSPFRDGVLVVDRSISGSRSIVRKWRELVGDRSGAVKEFDSTQRDSASTFVLDAMGSATHTVYFGHAQNDPLDPLRRGLVVGRDEFLGPERIRAAHLGHVQSLLLIACEGGRSHPFLSANSPAHAFASAGIQTVIATLWSILAKDGARYLERFLNHARTNPDLRADEIWSKLIANVDQVSLPFFCMTAGKVSATANTPYA